MLAVLAAFAASGCSFDLVPTRDELSRSGGIAARAVKLKSWGTPAAAFVEIASEGDAQLSDVALATADSPCGRGPRAFIVSVQQAGEASSWLDDLYVPSADEALAPDRLLLPAGKTIAKVSLPASLVALAERALALDFMVASPAGEPPRCLRVPLWAGPTGDGDWRVVGGRLFGSVMLRAGGAIGFGHRPVHCGARHGARSAVRPPAVQRALRCRVGAVRGTCPLAPAVGELSNYVGVGVGTEVLLVRAERWLVGAELGYRFRLFRPLDDTSGPVRAVQHAPWIGLRLLGTTPPLRVFSPPLRRRAYGVELTAERLSGDAGTGTQVIGGFVLQWP